MTCYHSDFWGYLLFMQYFSMTMQVSLKPVLVISWKESINVNQMNEFPYIWSFFVPSACTLWKCIEKNQLCIWARFVLRNECIVEKKKQKHSL